MNEKEKNNEKSKSEVEKNRLFRLYIEEYITTAQYYKIKERIKNGKKRS